MYQCGVNLFAGRCLPLSIWLCEVVLTYVCLCYGVSMALSGMCTSWEICTLYASTYNTSMFIFNRIVMLYMYDILYVSCYACIFLNKGIYSFEHCNLTEKFSFRWELNHMPLIFWASILTTRSLRPLLSNCPYSKGLYMGQTTLTTTVAILLWSCTP